MSTEERQLKHRQAYDAAVLAYEQYHAQLAFLGDGASRSRSYSGDDLSISVHSYFPPNTSQINSDASNHVTSTATLNTGFQHLASAGPSRPNSQQNRSIHSLDEHSYHGTGGSFHFHEQQQEQQPSSQLLANTGLRLYERTTSLTPGQIQSHLTQSDSSSATTAPIPLLRRLSSSSPIGFLDSPPSSYEVEDCFLTYNEVVPTTY